VVKSDKIIFLDIDGVLNPQHYENALFKMWKASFGEIKSHDGFGRLFFYQNVNNLERLIKETGADIVLSSSWRHKGLLKIQEMWKSRNLPGRVIDITPLETDPELLDFFDSVCRGSEIQLWINRNYYTGKYIIIDNTDDMLKSQEGQFIRTNGFFGLTNKDVERAIQLLS
jgi:hypothetical protein